jgi:hypothetical protein
MDPDDEQPGFIGTTVLALGAVTFFSAMGLTLGVWLLG